MVRNCAPENLEIPGLVLTHHPGMTKKVGSDSRVPDAAQRALALLREKPGPTLFLQ
jgi:hypothetical protein